MNDKIYIIGGRASGENAMTLVTEFNPSTGQWRRMADMPTARFSAGWGVVDGKIYVCGGKSGGSLLDAVEEFDPAAGESGVWRGPLARMPFPTAYAGSASLGGKIYVLGGYSPDQPSNKVYIFDPSQGAFGQWELGVPLRGARFYHSAVAADGRIFVFGGNMPNYVGNWNSAEEYDPSTRTWSARPTMPAKRALFAAVLLDGNIYCVGGYETTSASALMDVFCPGVTYYVHRKH